jgi:gamma-glutamyltranspeptidase/glutathione hydrolase
MVVADDREAAAWGAEVLRKGGNAVDAAVATAFYMSVSRPQYASLGGGGFMIYCPHSLSSRKSPCTALDFREKAPAAARKDMFLRNGRADTSLSQRGGSASGIPGVVAGWLWMLDKYGSKPRAELLSQAIRVARQGIRVTGATEQAARSSWSAMNAEAREIFSCGHGGQRSCAPGELLKQADLARLLEGIAKRGREAFYSGPYAELMVKALRSTGGVQTLEDFANYQPKERKVLSGQYKDYEILTMPPPSAGGAMILQMFQYLDLADNAGALNEGPESSSTVHALAHAMALAFRDRAEKFGDPDFVKVPLAELSKPERLKSLWDSTFDIRQKTPLPDTNLSAPREGNNTTHFAVIDAQGNAVSVTTTVNSNFGSGLVPRGTGVVMNNEMDDFSLEPGVPNQFGLVGSAANAIEGGKRPLSSMSPTIVRDAQGRVRIAIGASGGPRITSAVFLALAQRLRFGRAILDAVAVPRFHEQWKPDLLYLEAIGFGAPMRRELTSMGYALQNTTVNAKVEALERTPEGRVQGAPDPRSEGAAVAE